MHTALTRHIFDVALGLSQRDWNGEAFTRMKAAETQAATQLAALDAQRKANASPALPLDQYAATYSDSLLGDMKVAVENGALTLRFHPGFVARLEPSQHNAFRLDWQAASALSGPNQFATFTLDSGGRPIELRVDGFGTFRAPARGRGGRGGGG